MIRQREVETLAMSPARLVIEELTQLRVVEVVAMTIVAQQTGGFRLIEKLLDLGRGDRFEIVEQPTVAEECKLREELTARPADRARRRRSSSSSPPSPVRTSVVVRHELATSNLDVATDDQPGQHGGCQQWVAVSGLHHEGEQGP